MPIEFTMLAWAAVLAFIQIVLYAVFAVSQMGMPYALSARDEQKQLGGIAARLQRALANHLETLPLFAIAVFLGFLTERFDATTAFAAQLYFWSRVLYIPAYAFGIPWIRSAVWTTAILGILIIYWQILF